MQSDGTDLGSRFGRLEEQVAALETRVDALSTLVGGGLSAPAARPDSAAETGGEPRLTLPGGLSVPTALTALAVVCFLMVAALILRALTDAKVVNQEFGAVLGMGYAAALVLYGCRRRAAARPLSSVFMASGAFLLFSVVLETHARFQALSSAAAYTLLAAALVAMTGFGMRVRSHLLACLGVLGTALAGIALDFPDPPFPVLALLLFSCGVAAHLAGRAVAPCRWVRWPVLAVTLFFWMQWTIKGRAALAGIHGSGGEVYLPWMLPMLALFAAGWLAESAASMLEAGAVPGVYEVLLPPLAAAGAAAVGEIVLVPHFGAPVPVSAVGAFSAAAPLGLALGLSGRTDRGIWMVPSLVVAAIIPLVVFLPGCAGSCSAVMLACSLAALALPMVPGLVRHEPVWVVSHLFQGVVCGMAVRNGCLTLDTLASGGAMAAALLAGGVCLAHHVLSQRLAADDGGEEAPQHPCLYTAALPLVAGLIILFGFSRAALSLALARAGMDEAAFQAGQSVLINAGAITLALVGAVRMRGDIVAIAVAVAAVGAGKVFVYDLTHLHGIPAVVSVLSAGITTAVGAVLWARWQRLSDGGQPVGHPSA